MALNRTTPATKGGENAKLNFQLAGEEVEQGLDLDQNLESVS
jgi:hypothetical protein